MTGLLLRMTVLDDDRRLLTQARKAEDDIRDNDELNMLHKMFWIQMRFYKQLRTPDAIYDMKTKEKMAAFKTVGRANKLISSRILGGSIDYTVEDATRVVNLLHDHVTRLISDGPADDIASDDLAVARAEASLLSDIAKSSYDLKVSESKSTKDKYMKTIANQIQIIMRHLVNLRECSQQTPTCRLHALQLEWTRAREFAIELVGCIFSGREIATVNRYKLYIDGIAAVKRIVVV